jgi:hypothetical protein
MPDTQNTSSIQNIDFEQHFQNDLVNAIRDGNLVEIRWCDLTESEKRQAYNALFSPSNW